MVRINNKVNSNAIGSAYGCNVMIITIIMVSLMINESGKYNSNQRNTTNNNCNGCENLIFLMKM